MWIRLAKMGEMMDFGALLRRCRREKGLTQEQLAEKLSALVPAGSSYDASYISRMEGGRRQPGKRELVLSLAKALELNGEETYRLVAAAGYSSRSSEAALEAVGAVYQAFVHLADIVDARVAYRGGHSARVAVIVRLIAEEMELADLLIRPLEIAARVHDIGYLSVPSSIMAKPEPLTLSEMSEVQTHPAVAVRVLEGLECFREALPVIHSHHERYDGNGYPSRLAGERIPLEARILAVANVYDSMSLPKPYRPPLAEKEIVQILRDGKGRHWDPVIVDRFIGMLKRSSIVSPPHGF